MDEELLPIGQFARLGRLSIKQLRHYAELGLLVPAYVDEHTGYRYYRHEQARDALSIGLLRSLDVPLAVIAQVLSDTPGVLEGVHERLEVELAKRRSTLAALERVMTEGLPSTPVTVATEPARRVAVATVARPTRKASAGPPRLPSPGCGRRRRPPLPSSSACSRSTSASPSPSPSLWSARSR
ncbi:MerR family transcriptional regulator [Nonomuraea wenchangensis]|uniref:MerR family transcriptional regulator n=1 Tax=Nonomuraea wenchangensis TaxID=568860 RepID=UPI00371AF28B